MKKNFSPWLNQLKREREIKSLDDNKSTDILIIGAGIAGVMSTYFLLKNTNKKIILIDLYKAGHGASGHNAGQLTTYFERPLADIATEFGVNLACEAQKNVESAWDLIDEIVKDVKIKTPIYKFTGYAGMTSLKQIILHLADNMIRYDGDIPVEKMLIADDFEFLEALPSIYSHLYEITSRENILNLLETQNKEYVGLLAYPKGVTNSATICEELINYFINNFSERFEIYENSKIEKIILNEEDTISEVSVENKIDIKNNFNYKIESQKIILCTNGFEGFEIVNNFGKDIDKKFHHDVTGRINFMSGYLDNVSEDPIAISYFPKGLLKEVEVSGEQYFYMTRRPYMHDGEEMGLISTGGPERILKEGEIYNRENLCEEWAEKEIDNFLKNNYKKHKKEKVEYDFCWHGLLGYTTNGIRMIGKEPNNKNLLYNLGCNGIGIMPSIYGASKISKIINDEILPKSIFDPREN